MPIIRHQSGPRAGQSDAIEPSVERITFGRDPAVCDVLFPPAATMIARRHCALVRKPGGGWVFDDFGEPYVEINGKPAVMGQAVRSGDILTLGRANGPSLEFVAGENFLPNDLPQTEAQPYRTLGHSTARRAGRVALISLALALMTTLGLGAFFYLGQGERQRLSNLEQAQQRAAGESISAEVRNKLLQAAYVVTVRLPSGQERAAGTGAPVAENVIATNAHVAAIFNRLKEGEKLIVRSPGANSKAYEVLSVELHPAYEAFNAFQREDRIYVTTSRDCARCMPIQLSQSLSYDVALMRVAPGSNLTPVLEVASVSELHALSPGDPIAIAGYPLEAIRGEEVQGVAPTPNFRTGLISALTDMFYMPGDIERRRLITHNIPITGGNSGSPVLNARGKLVALINAGNMLPHADMGRMVNAATVNYAQRADLLLDLIAGRAQEQLKSEREYWAKQTAAFARGSEYLSRFVVEQLKPPGAETSVAFEQKGQLTKSDQYVLKAADGQESKKRQKVHQISVSANSGGVVIAYTPNQVGLELYLVVDNKIAAQDKRENVFLSFVKYEVKQDLKVDVYVVGGDEDASYTLTQHVWKAPGS